MKRLGLSNTKLQTGFLTIGELAKVLKVDRNTIRWWIKRHVYPIRRELPDSLRAFI